MAIPVHDHQEEPGFAEFFDGERQPSFTVALRGYHKEEVDEYLRELRDAEAQDADLRMRLEAEIDRLRRRVAGLENSLIGETPHTINALGERLGLILRYAEEGASDALAHAQAQAEAVRKEAAERAENFVRQASLRASQASQHLNAAKAEAAQLLEQSETEAARRGAEIVARAEHQAAAIVADARHQAEEIAQRARDDEARNREEMVQLRSRFDGEMEVLAGRRRHVLASLEVIQATVTETLADAGGAKADAGPTPAAATATTTGGISGPPAPAPAPAPEDEATGAAAAGGNPTREQPVVRIEED